MLKQEAGLGKELDLFQSVGKLRATEMRIFEQASICIVF